MVGPVQHRLQGCGKTVAVQGKAEQQQIAFQHFLKNGAHIVGVAAGPAVALAGKAAGTVFDVPVNNVDQTHLLRGRLLHPLQKRPGHVQRIAFVPLGASIEHHDFHGFVQKFIHSAY